MNRRNFIKTTAAASVAASSHAAGAPAASRIIDTHIHLYDPTRPQGVPWPPKDSPLYRKVFMEDWARQALPHGVKDTIIVEASEWVEDNQWILDIAAQDKRIVGFVGNLDPLAPDFSANLKRFSANPLFRGIRNRRPNAQLSDIVDTEDFRRSMKQLADAGLQLDVNAGSKVLPAVAKLAAQMPDFRIVINHVGGAGDPRELKPEWKDGMKLAGQHSNVFCKVSGLPEQTREAWGQAPQDMATYAPILDHVWSCFGEDRLVYGSNWPVSDKGAPYDAVFRVVQEYFKAKGHEATEKYFWKNSLTAYRWTER